MAYTPRKKFMARYSDINRAEELLAAKNKLEAWRELDRAAKAAAYQAARLGLKVNVGSSIGYFKAFGEVSDNFYWESKLLAVPTAAPKPGVEENNNTLITNVRAAVIGAGAAAETKPTGTNVTVKKARKIELARVVCTLPKTLTRTTTARTTGRPYTQIETDSVTCPFGASTAPNNVEEAVRQAIRTALKTSQPTARVSFKPQGYVG
jgi:hypothetical protein